MEEDVVVVAAAESAEMPVGSAINCMVEFSQQCKNPSIRLITEGVRRFYGGSKSPKNREKKRLSGLNRLEILLDYGLRTKSGFADEI